MSDGTPFEAPIIGDADICWVSGLLKLPHNAFYGDDRNDPRQKVLKSAGQLDIAACPGSGKTTLLVAKLAILAEKWRYRTSGICVLSHTNVARNQIETQLGNTAAGQILLAYPHYIGTIHGFVNDFLAVPWLRSLGYPIKMIDSEICELRRWKKLHYKWQSALENRHIDKANIRILDSNFNLGKRNGPFPFAHDTATYQNLQKACQETTREGYHCYDDMFVWADDMMNKWPYITGTIRGRFPLLFVDEAQDNSEEQSVILYRIFMDGNGAVIRQRFGDENQAIFDSIGVKEAKKDKFPVSEFRLPNSHRFGPKIAQLADPLGLIPYGLKGHGPKKPLASGLPEGRHTIFLFGEDRIEKVLDAYAELLIETFSEEELVGGTFTAVGQIHRQPEKKEKQKFPHSIAHYWGDYDPELTRPDPRPKTFVEYVSVGMTRAESSGETYHFVQKIAEGVLRLAGMMDDRKSFFRYRHTHSYVLELLEECADVRWRYEDLVARLAVKREPVTKKMWETHWCDIVREIAEAIAGVSATNPEVEGFLAWKDGAEGEMVPVAEKSRDNTYRYPRDDPKVHIRVGSIHSVKGETHTATLVLETYWQDQKGRHNMELLRPWLCGDKSGRADAGVHQESRLKLHYVATTRPSHLLCLAMKLSSFQNGQSELDDELIQKLGKRGWQIKLV